MNKIRIGIAGLSKRGLISWMPKLLNFEGFEVVAVCDKIEALNQKALDMIPHKDKVGVYTDYDEFLKHDMDAVALTVRCKDQGALAAQALEAGFHVSSEVPAAHTIEDCWKIVVASERSGKIYHLAEQTRFWGFIQAWTKLNEEQKLGKITYAEGQYIGHYGTELYYQDGVTGEKLHMHQLDGSENATATYMQTMHPIEYLPHELSPMLKVLDDRVVQVTAMGNRPQSYVYPELKAADMEVALMKTEKDTLLRLSVGFSQPVPHDDHHWYHFMGTEGQVEWRRRHDDKGRMWTLKGESDHREDQDWTYEPEDQSDESKLTGHGGVDHIPFIQFRDAVLKGRDAEIDVYQAMDTAAPAILAGKSIEEGSTPQDVPDFRPGPQRKFGEFPA